MDTRAIPQSQIPHTSALYQDYLYDYPRVSEYFPFPPFDPESFVRSAGTLQYPAELRAGVINAGDQTVVML